MILDINRDRDMVLPFDNKNDFFIIDRINNKTYAINPKQVVSFMGSGDHLFIECWQSTLILKVNAPQFLERYLTCFIKGKFTYSPN